MNSAARLHSILTGALAAKGPTTRQAWARVLSVSPDDADAVLLGLGGVLELIREVERDVLRLDSHDTSLHLAPLKEIRAAFTAFSLEEQWARARPRLSESAIRALTFTADVLRQVNQSGVVPEATLQALGARLDTLIAEVVEADCDSNLKHEVLRYLEYARRALMQYRTRGVEGLQEALDINLGLILRRQPAATESPAYAGTLRKLWNFLGELNTALSLAGYGVQLAPPVVENVNRLLGSG